MSKQSMTSGSIYKSILTFTIPLVLGNFFQLMYNAVDSIVVGNYVSKQALAAVGASTPLINLIIGFFTGVSVGAGVIIARNFGSKNDQKLSITIHTYLAFSMIVAIVLSTIGYIITPNLLQWISTPSDVMKESIEYLHIYFLGLTFLIFYNAGAGIYQAVGNTRLPLVYLGISSVINIVLDLVFVLQFNMGVSGVAWATFIAQAVSSVLIIVSLMKTNERYKVTISKIKLDIETCVQIIRIGVPSGFQNMIVSLSNVLVQGYVNGFGSAAMAGVSSANKFDNFIGLPINSFALAITTFTAQNLGANNEERAKEGLKKTLILSVLFIVGIAIPMYMLAPQCIQVFSKDSDVIKIGAMMMRIMLPFYFGLSTHQLVSGALRARGETMMPMISSIVSMVIVRQIILFIFMPIVNDVSLVAWVYCITWTLAMMITVFLYINFMKKHTPYKRGGK